MAVAHMCSCSEYKIITRCSPQLNSIEWACELKIKILNRLISPVQEHVIYFYEKLTSKYPFEFVDKIINISLWKRTLIYIVPIYNIFFHYIIRLRSLTDGRIDTFSPNLQDYYPSRAWTYIYREVCSLCNKIATHIFVINSNVFTGNDLFIIHTFINA